MPEEEPIAAIPKTEETFSNDNPSQTDEPVIQNPKGLITALERLKEEQKTSQKVAEQLQSKIKQYESALGELSPADIKKIREEQLVKEKRFEELVQSRNSEIQKLSEELDRVNLESQRLRMEFAAKEAFIEAGGIPEHFVAVKQVILSRCKLTEEGKVVILDEEGNIPFLAEERRHKTPKEVLVDDFVSSEIWGSHFRVRVPSGSGAVGSTGLTISQQDLASLSPAERREQARKHGFKK